MARTTNKPPGRGWRPLFLSFLGGMVVLAGIAVATTATDQAMFCGSCHSMDEAALTHRLSVHAELACNECHAPHNLLAKLPFKAKEGTRDIIATVSSSVPDLIHAGDETMQVIQENCRRCHDATVNTVNMTAKPFCTDCHRHVPHSPKIPVAKRSAADV